MPLSRRLVRRSQPQHQILPPLRSRNLQSNRQPAFRKTARHRDRRQSPNIERPSVAQQPKFRRTQRVRIFSKIGNRRCRDRHRRRNQQINVSKEVTSSPSLQIHLAPPPNIFARRNVRPGEDAPQSLRLIKLRSLSNIIGVISVRLSSLHSAVGRHVNPHIMNLRHKRSDHDKSPVNRSTNFVIKIIKEISPGYSNANFLNLVTQARNVIRHRNLSATNVEWIVSSDGFQNNRRIANSRGQRSNMIERPRKWNHPTHRDAAISRLDPHTPAQRSRFANRARRVSPNRRITKPGSHSSRRTSGRSSRDVPRVPGVVNIAEETDQRTPTISELMQIVLAHNHRTGLPQPSHNFRIFSRNTVLKHRAGSGSACARGIDQVFQRDRNPVQRPAPHPTHDLSLCRPRLRQSRLASNGDKSIQHGVELLDSIQASPSQFNRRNFLAPKTRTQFNDSFQSSHVRELLIVVDAVGLPCVPLCPLCLRFSPKQKSIQPPGPIIKTAVVVTRR